MRMAQRVRTGRALKPMVRMASDMLISSCLSFASLVADTRNSSRLSPTYTVQRLHMTRGRGPSTAVDCGNVHVKPLLPDAGLLENCRIGRGRPPMALSTHTGIEPSPRRFNPFLLRIRLAPWLESPGPSSSGLRRGCSLDWLPKRTRR